MTMTWLRWHHGTICDPRFTVIARKSGQSRALVLAVWSGILECGSQADERGTLDEFEPDTLAACLDVEEEAITAIYQAMQDKQLIHEGRIANWDRTQSYRGTTSYTSSSTSSERVRRFRERQKFIAGEMQIAATPEIPEVITPDQIHTPVTGYEYVAPGNNPALVTHETLHETVETLHETVETPDTDTDTDTDQKRKEQKRGKEKRVSVACATAHPRKRKVGLPTDFGISDAVREWACKNHFGDLDQHLESFKDKATARGYQYADWDAAFRNAIRDDWAGLRKMAAFPGGGRRQSNAPSAFTDPMANEFGDLMAVASRPVIEGVAIHG